LKNTSIKQVVYYKSSSMVKMSKEEVGG